jgi:Exportin 1-like protein
MPDAQTLTHAALCSPLQVFLNKLNIILVQILKQDWPHKWKSFVPDIVGASKTSETLCENSMVILKLLSEEVGPPSPIAFLML